MALADGEPLTGIEAADIELINEAVPFERLEARVAEIAAMLARIPLSQLQSQKLIVNQAYENMGLASTQTLGGILDGLMRNTPEAVRFIDTAASDGVRAAVEHCLAAAVTAGKPAGVNAFNPDTAHHYLASGAAFVLVGADVALLARGSEALAAAFIKPDGGAPDSY